jgi:hypothetical protein
MVDGAMATAPRTSSIHGFLTVVRNTNGRMVNMDLKSEINLLIEKLAFVENKELRQIMLDGFIKKHGEIPDEYKDAVNAVVEM